MGFFRKNKHNIEEINNDTMDIDMPKPSEDDFAEDDTPIEITREEFKKMAEENFQDAITEVSSDNDLRDTDETDIEDDFDFSIETEEEPVRDIPLDLPNPEPEPVKEKKERMTFSEFYALHTKGCRITLTSLAVFIFICLGFYVYGCMTIPQDVIGRKIYIEDVNVSGLTYNEALLKVKATTLLDNCNITVTSHGRTYNIDGLDVGLTARTEDTVAKAMMYGKTGNVLDDGYVNTLQLVKKHTIVPSVNVNEQILREKLAEFGNQIHGELVEHKLEIGDGVVICTPGHTGFSGNTDTAYEQVITAINNEDFSKIRVTLDTAPPKTLTEKDIDAFTYRNPSDARYEYSDNTVTVIPEEIGRYLDIEQTKTLVSQLYEGGEVVKIPFSSSEPAVTAEVLNQKLFNATLGSFKTAYGGSTANRASNVANAASRINGKVLAPGEVFSFNDTVGKRTVANGFHPAPEYANGQTVIGIGGGTCQVSSTLYNSVLLADLSIVTRSNHMFPVGYCPLGRDATVTDSGLDFKFANNTEYPIKISSATGGGYVTIDIIGTQRDQQHIVHFSTSTEHKNGNTIVYLKRLVYDENEQLIREEKLPTSTYMPH